MAVCATKIRNVSVFHTKDGYALHDEEQKLEKCSHCTVKMFCEQNLTTFLGYCVVLLSRIFEWFINFKVMKLHFL